MEIFRYSWEKADFAGYKLIIVPSFVHLETDTFKKMVSSGAKILAGSRTE